MGMHEGFRIQFQPLSQSDYVVRIEVEFDIFTTDGETGYARMASEGEPFIAKGCHSLGKFCGLIHWLTTQKS
jgi:hypothetical protein